MLVGSSTSIIAKHSFPDHNHEDGDDDDEYNFAEVIVMIVDDE